MHHYAHDAQSWLSGIIKVSCICLLHRVSPSLPWYDTSFSLSLPTICMTSLYAHYRGV